MTFDEAFEKNEEVANMMLEAAWVSRWNKKKTAIYAILEPEEAMGIVAEIFTELDNLGYDIIKKS